MSQGPPSAPDPDPLATMDTAGPESMREDSTSDGSDLGDLPTEAADATRHHVPGGGGPPTVPVTQPGTAATERLDDDEASYETSAASGPSAPAAIGEWKPPRPGGALEPGKIAFDRYRPIQRLGGGGMGEVWLVEHLQLETQRALKLILPRISFDSMARARFRREAQLMAKFTHPNAVTVHDARLTEDDVAFIEMEYVRGRSLDLILENEGPLPLDLVARLLDQLCEVLQVAHDHKILHRDLKPSNLMLIDGRPVGREHLKVLDFGIAKSLATDEIEFGERTITGSFVGTPPYASPEQAERDADHRSDLYSVGIILCELLTGRRPFSGPLTKVIADTVNRPPPSFRELNPAIEVPPEVEAVVRRCLAKDPADRYQTALEIAEAFRAALPASPLDEFGEVRGKGQAESKLPRWAWPAIAGAAVVVALGLFAVPRLFPSPNPGPDGSGTTPVETVALPPEFRAAEESEPAPDGLPTAIVSDRDGSLLVRLPGGEFEVGEDGVGGKKTVPGFYMQEHEVTNAQLAAYYKANDMAPPAKPAKSEEFDGDDQPAVYVDFATAEAYAHWIGGRLPTEVEWEYAARSGGKPDRPYVWSEGGPLVAADNRANIGAPEYSTPTQKVKRSPDDQTEQGVFDLTGNVREWCRRSDGGGPSTDAAVRGGSWKSFYDEFTTYAGRPLDPSERLNDLGFRVVVEWPADPASAPVTEAP